MYRPRLSDDARAYVELAQEYADKARPFMFEGWAVRYDEGKAEKGGVFAFEIAHCRCGEEMTRVAQFRHQERVFCIDYCPHCADGYWDVSVRSVSLDEAGGQMAGMSAWSFDQMNYLPSVDDPKWDEALQAMELKGAIVPDDHEAFHHAMAYVLDCVNHVIHSRVGGAVQWIQSDETPECPHCQSPMVFLAQLEEPQVCWGDSGALYAFWCPQHPEVGGGCLQTC